MTANEKAVVNKLLNGLYHRMYASRLKPEAVLELAKKHNVNVEVTEYRADEIRCLFEVKP